MRNFADETPHLAGEIRRIVDDAQIRVSGPAGNDFFIHCNGLLRCFRARLIVGQRIEFFGAFCCCHEMKNGVVVIAKRNLAASQLAAQRFPFGVCHVSFVIGNAAVCDNQNFFVFHIVGCHLKHALFLNLQRDERLLKIIVGVDRPRCDTAQNQFRCSFRNKKNFIALFGEIALNPCHSS